MNIQADFAGAMKKAAALRRIPAATKKQASRWAADTVKELKISAKSMHKSEQQGRGKTGHLARNIGMVVTAGEDHYQVLVGTGVGSLQTVKYASIQDKGGTIRAKGKMLTIPFPGVKGRASNFDCFPLRTAKGNVILFEAKHNKRGTKTTLKPLFLLRRQVTLPATEWFSRPMAIRKPALEVMMQPSSVYKVAEEMV